MQKSIKKHLLINVMVSMIIVTTLVIAGTLFLQHQSINQHLAATFNKLPINRHIALSTEQSTQHLLDYQLAYNAIITFLITFPILSFIIWLIIDRSLAPLQRITKELSERPPLSLTPVDLQHAPQEIQPFMSSLNRLFERLTDAMEREKRFASDAAHELRTPLAVLSAQTQVALRAECEQERHEALMNIVTGVKRSGHVVHQLLTLSRMVPQATIQEPKIFDIKPLAAEMVADIVPQALTKDIEIELDAPDSTYTSGNAIAITILLRNLIDNAVRYSPPGGKTIVTTRDYPDDNRITLCVTDTGPGIPAELRERVFERFFRVDTSKASGSGLGLGIVKQIVKLHNGRIELRTPKASIPNAEGNPGLEFLIHFPRFVPEATSNE